MPPSNSPQFVGGTDESDVQDHTDNDIVTPGQTTSSGGARGRTAITTIPKGPFPIVPSTVQDRTIDCSQEFDVQPVKAEELTAWAINLIRTTNSGIFRKVAADDAINGIKVERLLRVRVVGDVPVKLRVTRPQNLDAIYAQLTGEEQTEPCRRCTASSGPFRVCVKHPRIGTGACAGCHYNSGATQCSFRPDIDTAKGAGRKGGKGKAVKTQQSDDEGVQDRKVLYIANQHLRPLRKLRAAHWEAIGAVAEAMATGNWTIQKDSDSESSGSVSNDSDSAPAAKKQRCK